MHFLGDLGGRIRLWNGPNQHGGATTGPAYPEGGAFDSGWYDPSTGQCDTEGKQFARFADLAMYAAQQGEQLKYATEAEARAICATGAPTAGPQAAVYTAREGGTSTVRYTPPPPATGVPTPQVITVPGGETVVIQPEPAAPEAPVALPEWALPAGIGLLFLLLRR